jgi:hypothetical protein
MTVKKACDCCDPPMAVEEGIRTCDLDEEHEGYECPKSGEWFSEDDWDTLDELEGGEEVGHPLKPEFMLPSVVAWFSERVKGAK